MQSAAAAERERVERELLRLGEREGNLTLELDAIREARSALQDELVVLRRLSRARINAAEPWPRPRRAKLPRESSKAVVRLGSVDLLYQPAAVLSLNET